MPAITITKKELKDAVKESVREALAQEIMNLRALLIPYLSEKEQVDIERLYGKPTRKIVKKTTLTV